MRWNCEFWDVFTISRQMNGSKFTRCHSSKYKSTTNLKFSVVVCWNVIIIILFRPLFVVISWTCWLIHWPDSLSCTHSDSEVCAIVFIATTSGWPDINCTSGVVAAILAAVVDEDDDDFRRTKINERRPVVWLPFPVIAVVVARLLETDVLRSPTYWCCTADCSVVGHGANRLPSLHRLNDSTSSLHLQQYRANRDDDDDDDPVKRLPFTQQQQCRLT